jgi:hypothetical protein
VSHNISCGLPVLSIDTKKKELLGNFYREGYLYTNSNITRAWQGVPFDSYKTVVELAAKAKTKTGFSVDVWVNEKIYQTGGKASDDFMDTYPVKLDDVLPLWNYSLI